MKKNIIFFLSLSSFIIFGSECYHTTKVLIDGSKYKDDISYLTVPILNGVYPSVTDEKDLIKILNESLSNNCLNYFKSNDKKSNFSTKILYKYIKKKLGSSKVNSLKSKLKNNDILFLIELSKNSIRVELYNNRLNIVAKYNNTYDFVNISTINETLNRFYEEYLFTDIIINKNDKMLSDDIVIMNGKTIGNVNDFRSDVSGEILVHKIPRNIKSYIQIESNTEDRISEKYFIKPSEFYLKKKNKKSNSRKIKEFADFQFRDKVGSFKLKLSSGSGKNLNTTSSKVKLYNLRNISGIKTNLITNDDYILVSTDKKYTKNWNFVGKVNSDLYPNPFPKIVTLVDTSSYKLHTNPITNFILTKTSKPKTYAYNFLLPGISGFLVNSEKNKFNKNKSLLSNTKFISGLTLSSYLLSSFYLINSHNNFIKFKDNYEKNLLYYNTSGQSTYRDLTNLYYNKSIKTEKEVHLSALLVACINVFSNYYISSKWFLWD